MKLVRKHLWLSLLFAGLLTPGCSDDSAGSDVADLVGDAGDDVPINDADDVETDVDGPLETIAFETGSLSLRVTVSPFGLTLRDANGDLVLETLRAPLEAPTDPAVGAYGPPAATHNAAAYDQPLHWGWDSYVGEDEPWTAFDETISATHEVSTVRLVLGSQETDAELHISIEVEVNQVRVRMTLDEAGREIFNRLGQSFRLGPDEHFYGLGGRQATVDHRGWSFDNVVQESGVGLGEGRSAGPANPEPNGLDMTSFPVPFVLSSAGYGFWLDDSDRSTFHLGAHSDQAWRAEVAGTELSYRVYLGRDPLRTLEAFTADVGRPALPPLWAFGPRRRVDPTTEVDGMPEWEALRARGVPTTVIEETLRVLPDDALDGEAATVSARARAVAQWGYRLLGYASPYVSADDPRATDDFADAAARGLLVLDSTGEPYRVTLFGEESRTVGLLDFTHPEANAWLGSHLAPGLDFGYAGWRLDHGEYTPPDAVFYDGRSGAELRNLYPLLAQSAVWDELTATRPDDFLLVARSGFTGSAARIHMMWLAPTNASFDPTDGLPSAVRATINLGLSGVPLVGADIGGNQAFSDPPPDCELYLRWAAFASMSPAMHDENVGIGSHDAAEWWGLWRDEQTVQAYAELARRHTRLAPYRRGLAREAAERGTPLVRHLLLHHPDDPEVWSVDDEYYLGSALLVAPILERGTFSRDVYLPAGHFVDWDTGEVFEGPGREMAEAAFERIPVFLADGGIVPMLDASIETLVAEDNEAVVGLTDVADWLDVRALRSVGSSTFEMADGTVLSIELTGEVRPPFAAGETQLPVVFTVAEAQDCDGCYLLRGDTEPPRLWVTTPLGENIEVVGQGIRLTASHPATRPRRVRWDVILLPAIERIGSEPRVGRRQ